MADPTIIPNKRAELEAEAEKHLAEAYTYEEAGKLQEALQQCELAIELTPELAEAHNLQGIILEQLGHGEQAIIAYSEAIRLDPEFEEAKLNLREAQNEILESQRVLDRKRARKIALWGALGYGISFAIVRAVLAVLFMQTVTETMPGGGHIISPKYGYYQYLAIATLLHSFASGIGALVLGKAIRSNRTGRLVLVGALGYGIAYSVTAIVFSVPYRVFSLFFAPYQFPQVISTIISTIGSALTGAFVGFLLGSVQKGAKQSVRPALAGAAFGLFGLIYPLTSNLLMSTVYWNFTHYELAAITAGAVQGALVGGIAGALLGLAIGQPRPANRQIGKLGEEHLSTEFPGEEKP